NIRGVRLQFDNGELQVFANNPDQEQAEERLGVDYNGEPLQIGFNVVYLIDVLNAIEHDQVRVTLSGANSSALIESAGDTSGDNVYVVMPMRL
ncbi:MAG: DNA polymerase III subunit beta, partial [Gammaproteobacteria bacterium]|nr:DNA polymerase III subunit beta [Gammaproteobacteria bacterium]